MESCAPENECPVCKNTIQNPSEPSPCCRKLFCQSCLTQSVRIRQHCPHCRSRMLGQTFAFTSVRIRRVRLPGLAASSETFGSVQPVGNSIQTLINQLRDARMQMQEVQVSTPSEAAAPAAQATPPPPPPSLHLLRPTPRPRLLAQTHASELINTETFGSVQPAGNSIQTLINQLRDAQMQMQEVQMSTPSETAAPAAQATPPPPPLPSLPLLRRPTPRPRLLAQTQASVLINTATQPAPAINPVPSAPVNPPQAPSTGRASVPPLVLPDSSFHELDEMAWRTEIAFMENASRRPSGPTVRTFSCPYCQLSGLDDLDLRDHCNDNHLSDTRRVVCPVCVSLPHGDPLYQSRDFIGHLNLRHCYYIHNVTNIHQSDDVNLQAAILMSLTQAK